MAGIDTKTRYQGVYGRHQLHCALAEERRCDCIPRYFGVVWDRQTQKHRKTGYHATPAEANNARTDLAVKVRQGVTDIREGLSFEEGQRRFIAAARSGVALNKRGRPYKEKAIINLDSSLGRLPDSIRKTRMDKVSRGDVQRAIDDFRRDGLSSSRIRSIVNSTRAFYRWAQDREHASQDPAAGVRLPANDSKPRERVATPAEFRRLLAALERVDALPWALAGYGTARAEEIRQLQWSEVDLKAQMMFLAEDESGRKSDAARRAVPLVKPLARMLRKAWVADGRPAKGPVCPPRNASSSGKLSLGALQKRVFKEWEEAEMQPIGLQDSRHTAATWLDHAKVSPKVASTIMGHRAPRPQPDAAPITLGRYTHVRVGELERARDLLDAFLAEREDENTTNSTG